MSFRFFYLISVRQPYAVHICLYCTVQTSVYSELDTRTCTYFSVVRIQKEKKDINAVVDIICQTYGPQCTLIYIFASN